MERDSIACGGCGATENSKRCIGCLHDFGTPESEWVRKYTAALSPQREDTGEGWFARNADRRNPDAFIRTDPAYFASECADAIVAGRLAPAPTEGVAAADRIAALESALRKVDGLCPTLGRDSTTTAAQMARIARAALSDGGDHAR